jgi:hypothetical protein
MNADDANLQKLLQAVLDLIRVCPRKSAAALFRLAILAS